jgi:hypothetical protein
VSQHTNWDSFVVVIATILLRCRQTSKPNMHSRWKDTQPYETNVSVVFRLRISWPDGTAPPSSRAPRNGVLVRQGFIPFLHQPFDINNMLRGLDNPSRPRPCCTLACRCGRGPTQGTCKRELTAEGLLPSIRMRVRILFVAYDDKSQNSGRKQAHF